MRRLSALAAAVACSSLLAACGGSAQSVPTTLAPRTLPAPPTTSVPASTAPTTALGTGPVPPVITIAYVDAVFAQLLKIYSKAVAEVVNSRSIPPSVPGLLHSIYGDAQLNRELDVFSQAIVTGAVNTIGPADVSQLQLLATRLTTAQRSCIEALADAATSPVAVKTSTWLVLRPKVAADDPTFINSTQWQITYQLTTQPEGSDACS